MMRPPIPHTDRSVLAAIALCVGLALVVALPEIVSVARAQSASQDLDPITGQSRVDRLEMTLQSVVDENRRLAEEVSSLQREMTFIPLDAQAAFHGHDSPAIQQSKLEEKPLSGFTATYDNGFVIRSNNLNESPFSLKINHQSTFRYSGFDRDERSWIDSAGNVKPINSSSDFLIPRGRLIFSGNAWLPKLSYLLNIDYNTVSSDAIGFRAYSLSYRFSRALEMSVGQNKVPGSREWLLSSWVAQEGPDRSMATTFFRPSLSQGIWCRGEPIDGLYYHAMFSNGFNTLNKTPNQFDQRACWSDSVWWEPLGDFGPGYSDLEDHDELAMRAGSSYTFALGQGSQSDSEAIENSAVRLSDGTLITQPGALSPGVTLQRYDLSLVAMDLAFKFRGCSLSTEIYFQELSSLQGSGSIQLSPTRAHGGFAQGGFFLLPRKIELYSRTSWVTGEFGSGTEVGSGFNWFVLPGKSNLRYTFDVAGLDSSPADQNRTGFVAGQSGILVRTQINASF